MAGLIKCTFLLNHKSSKNVSNIPCISPLSKRDARRAEGLGREVGAMPEGVKGRRYTGDDCVLSLNQLK
jgi:hypothetical protein